MLAPQHAQRHGGAAVGPPERRYLGSIHTRVPRKTEAWTNGADRVVCRGGRWGMGRHVRNAVFPTRLARIRLAVKLFRGFLFTHDSRWRGRVSGGPHEGVSA